MMIRLVMKKQCHIMIGNAERKSWNAGKPTISCVHDRHLHHAPIVAMPTLSIAQSPDLVSIARDRC
jgi:hypothetical protein